ncbi:MAG: hypothetical protein AVDCRST_MAG43-1116 [uncultured Thermomicrobiales bacterium]|uniref:Uncharacterized protein n=1 Tax=uncultured Thermomicrobiales bacterium TaxID=1645740 RepID=A0A6J4UIW4_9BACT|nr:MAG: hypothetical protein AVDCRST_MAG43-1116 [uncultured Thermomicrobiales bacterium]
MRDKDRAITATVRDMRTVVEAMILPFQHAPPRHVLSLARCRGLRRSV